MSTEPEVVSHEQEVERAVEAVYEIAAHQMQSGVADAVIEQNLVEQGLTPEVARIVVQNLGQARNQARRESGKKKMLYGALWCVGGTAVTAFTYSSASTGGGSYYIFWGAIIFGAIEFFWGLGQYMQAGPEN